jgi:hypothetical protein
MKQAVVMMLSKSNNNVENKNKNKRKNKKLIYILYIFNLTPIYKCLFIAAIAVLTTIIVCQKIVMVVKVV